MNKKKVLATNPKIIINILDKIYYLFLEVQFANLQKLIVFQKWYVFSAQLSRDNIETFCSPPTLSLISALSHSQLKVIRSRCCPTRK